MNEDRIEKLEREVQSLRNIIEKFVYVDRFQFDKNLQHKGDKLSFYGALPITQPTTGVGKSGNMTTPGGTNVQEMSAFYGNTAYYDSGNGTAYTIPDIVTILKDLGILEI